MRTKNTRRSTGRFIGSESLSQLVKYNWFGTSLDWFTRSAELTSLEVHLLYCTLHAMFHESILKVDFQSLTHVFVSYLTKFVMSQN